MERLLESIIDYPQNDLSRDIWVKQDSQYLLKDDVKEKILATLKEYPHFDLTGADEIRIVGSLTVANFV